jgi:DNA-binding XRE family transcriptional regulator
MSPVDGDRHRARPVLASLETDVQISPVFGRPLDDVFQVQAPDGTCSSPGCGYLLRRDRTVAEVVAA